MEKQTRRNFLKSAFTFIALIGTVPFLRFLKHKRPTHISAKKARYYEKLAG